MTGNEEVAPGDRDLLVRAYSAYDHQDVDALTALLADDVDWPDGGGERLHGKDAVRAYWTEQWTRVLTHDEPVGFAVHADGRVGVRIDQVVRSLDGRVLTEERFLHLHRIEAGRIARLDIERLADQASSVHPSPE